MSALVFPSIPGMGFPVKTPIWSTRKQAAVSGVETAISLMSYPRYKFAVPFELLRVTTAPSEFATLLGFFNQLRGGYDTFLYDDPSFDTATLAAFGTGNGTTTAFQLLVPNGGFNEVVQNLNGAPSVFVNTIAAPAAGLSAPGVAALTDQAGGALAGTTYYVRCSWVTPWGETLAGTEANRVVAVNRQLIVTQPASPPAGATAWNVYVSNTAGGGSGAEKLQTTGTNIAIGTTTWTEPTSGLAGATSMPGANGTTWAVGSTGIVTFATAPAAAAALTWSGSGTPHFYFRCRFVSDAYDFEQMFYQMWAAKKLEFMSVKL